MVADAWVPPDGADLAYEPYAPPAQHSQPDLRIANPHDQTAPEWPTQPVVVPADSDFPTYDTQDTHDTTPDLAPGSQAVTRADHSGTYERSTTPMPSSAISPPVPVVASGGLTLPEERALGAVLVEGALLTPRKLEVLKGIKSMLASVEMDFKLGELALLFRFLSPDQLLAALLVSRKVVSPQQIAALGQIKQELGRSGINYDLETLLVTFHIMTREDLARVRADLA